MKGVVACRKRGAEESVELDANNPPLISKLGEGVPEEKGLVSCSKRRAEESVESNHPCPISKLGENELEEILIRLPDPRSVVQLKIVSKRWCSVISNPFFFRRFRQAAAAAAVAEEELPIPPCPESMRNSILSFFPVSDDAVRDRFEVFNCAEDDNLFLCGFWGGDRYKDELARSLFVCNLRTKQWIALPPLPVRPPGKWFTLLSPTLVCEPCSNSSANLDLGDGETFVYSEFRFRVLLMYHYPFGRPGEYSLQSQRLYVYCSSDGKWTSHVLGYELCLGGQNHCVFQGYLYWLDYHSTKRVVKFNPFRLDQTPRFLDASSAFGGSLPSLYHDSVWFSLGHLHIVRVNDARNCFSVWRFEAGGGQWIQVSLVRMDTLWWRHDNKRVYEDSFSGPQGSLYQPCAKIPGGFCNKQKSRRANNSFLELLFGKLCHKCDSGGLIPESHFKFMNIVGLHPTDPQVVYCEFENRLTMTHCRDSRFGVVCNLRTRTLELFTASYRNHSGRVWASLFKKPRRPCCSVWPTQIRNLGGMYNNGNPPADQDCPKKNKRRKKSEKQMMDNTVSLSAPCTCTDKATSSTA